MISVSKPTWWITTGVWPVKTFGFTQIKEGIGSTHWGILEHIPWTLGSINTCSKQSMVEKSRGYNLPKALCIREGTSRGFCIRRTLSDDISTKVPTVHSGADASIGTQPEEERMQGDHMIEQLTNSKLNRKGFMISSSRDQKQMLWLRMEWLNRLRGTTDGN